MTATTPSAPRSRRFAQKKRPRSVRNAWFATRYLLGSHRLTFGLLRVLPAPYSRVMVEAGMDACIEGLPRSANTFGGWAFLAQNPGVDLAHHVHMPEQADRALRVGVPCAVLVREPIGTLTSLVIAGENDLSHELAYRTYLHYFRRIGAIRDRVAVCTFEEVLDDPSVIGRRLNARYGTSFNEGPMGEAEKREIVEGLEENERQMGSRPGHGTVPNAHKEGLKPAVREALKQHRLLPEARRVYGYVADGAV